MQLYQRYGIADFKADFGTDFADRNHDVDTEQRLREKNTLLELVKIKSQESWEYTLSSDIDFGCEYGVRLFGKVTPDKFDSFSIPDLFELQQMRAIQRGAEIGDLIDPYSGEIVEKRGNTHTLPVVKKKNIFQRLADKVTKKKELTIKYKDMRRN